MRNYWFSIRERGIFCPGKQIKGLSGGVRRYAAQAGPQIDAARAEKNRFRMKTNYFTREGTMLPDKQRKAYGAFYDAARYNDILEPKTTLLLHLGVAMAMGCSPCMH